MIKKIHCQGAGAEVTIEAGGFTEALRAERETPKGLGRGTPSRRWSSGGLHQENFENLHLNGAF